MLGNFDKINVPQEGQLRQAGQGTQVAFDALALEAQAAAKPKPQSELGYAAGEAEYALNRLAQSIEILAAKLEPVLSSHPVPATADGKTGQAVSSKLASALIGHAQQLDSLVMRVRGILSRLAI